tara:strand:- start:525 stop:830 length:306 start_codon:yes stop_codon:yes gene_type:complete
VAEFRVDDIKGVFTNGDPDQLGSSFVKELINFKSKNGKIVKTFGASDLEICPSISNYVKDYEVENVIVYPNNNFTGNKYRYMVLLKNSKTGKLMTIFDRGI